MPGRWISGHFRSAMILSAASILPFVLVYTILPRTALALPPGAPGCLANIILQLDTPDFAPNPPDPDGCGWIEEDHVCWVCDDGWTTCPTGEEEQIVTCPDGAQATIVIYYLGGDCGECTVPNGQLYGPGNGHIENN